MGKDLTSIDAVSPLLLRSSAPLHLGLGRRQFVIRNSQWAGGRADAIQKPRTFHTSKTLRWGEVLQKLQYLNTISFGRQCRCPSQNP